MIWVWLCLNQNTSFSSVKSAYRYYYSPLAFVTFDLLFVHSYKQKQHYKSARLWQRFAQRNARRIRYSLMMFQSNVHIFLPRQPTWWIYTIIGLETVRYIYFYWPHLKVLLVLDLFLFCFVLVEWDVLFFCILYLFCSKWIFFNVCNHGIESYDNFPRNICTHIKCNKYLWAPEYMLQRVPYLLYQR